MASNRDIRRMQAALDRLEPQMRRAVVAALERLRRRVFVSKLLGAIERSDEWAMRTLVSSLPRDLAVAGEVITKAFHLGGREAKSSLSPVARTKFAFNHVDARTVQAAESTAARFVTGVTNETRKAIRSVITRAFKDGISPRDTAQLIKPLIGLSERQALAVVNRRLRNKAAGMAADKVAKDADRYALKLLRQRAELIARTELAMASTDGQLAGWRQARDQGLLSRQLVRRWIVTPDDRLCPSCAPMDGATAPLDVPFAGGVMGPPLHPLCRCAVGLTDPAQSARVAA